MNIAVGQVYRRRDNGRRVVVLEVRDEQHERGLGQGYGDSGVAFPISTLDQERFAFSDFHPFDAWVLCDRLPSHGDAKWELVETVDYIIDRDREQGTRRFP